MFQKSSLAVCVLAALLVSVPACASDIIFPGGGTLAQVMDGGGTSTIITIVNLDSVIASYTLFFYDDNGHPLTLSTTAGAPAVSLSGSLPVGGSTIFQTNGGGSAVIQGYAVLATQNQVGASAVFGMTLGGVFVQASCPLDTGLDYLIAIPFDQTTGATAARTGLAIANSFGDQTYQINGGSTVTVAVTFYDQNGTATPLTSVVLPFGQHTSFMFDEKYPQTVGKKGILMFQGTDALGSSYAYKVLGLHATAATLTSITPLIPCNYSSTAGSCTN
jgi:hypothetical protein